MRPSEAAYLVKNAKEMSPWSQTGFKNITYAYN